MRPCLFLAVALGLAVRLTAAEYFVEKVGDDANPGTRMQPFKTIQKAASLMVPGDVCTVSRGVYRETIRPAVSGKPGTPLLFQAATGETVTISGADESSRWQQYTGGVYRANAEGMIQILVDESPALPCLSMLPDTTVPRPCGITRREPATYF